MLLHTCCAPCAIYSLNYWRENGKIPRLYYFNPNIHPFMEYQRRLETLKEFATNENVELIVSPEYPYLDFLRSALEVQDRCLSCYTTRLEATAKQAVLLGEKEISTTLLISPYQKHELLKETGEKIAEKYGIVFLYADLRPGFRSSQTISKERKYYRQPYCGCIFSEFERYSPSRKQI